MFGDFFGLGEIEDVENQLRGVKYELNSIKNALEKVDLNKYIRNVTAEQIAEIIY